MRMRRPILAASLVVSCGGKSPAPEELARAFQALHRPLIGAQYDRGSLPDLYDQLSRSLHGEALTQHFLEAAAGRRVRLQRGAQVEVTTLTYEDVHTLAQSEGSTTLSATWVVTGDVTHGGHAHDRTIRYEARYNIANTDAGIRIIAVHPTQVERMPGPAPRRVTSPDAEPNRSALDLLGEGQE